MTIWILFVVLMGSAAGMGYRQGAIRVAFSLIGIPIAALLAIPLSRFVRPAFTAFGIESPILLPILSSLLVFILILTIFKVGGFAVHRQADVYYRYKAGDLRFALWERLNNRLGLCLGLVNGLLYLVLISGAIFMGSYWTVQMETADTDMKSARLLNMLGKDLQSTSMTKVAVAMNKMPDYYYEAADIVGLVYQNPLLQARLSRYPPFLGLAERPELQGLANDSSYTEMLIRRAPIGEVLRNPRTQEVLKNKELLGVIRNTVEPNLADLRTFLETGKSAKFDAEPILGRWFFDSRGAIAAYRKEKPNVPSTEVQKIRRWMNERFAKTTLVVVPDHEFVLKNLPRLTSQNPSDVEVKHGQWLKDGTDYALKFDGTTETRKVEINGSQMTLKAEGVPWAFTKED